LSTLYDIKSEYIDIIENAFLYRIRVIVLIF